ncbi:hypothetical protein FHS31_001000 [Sphingomonas vulcanisoli]|uniref:Uncharacterized protein n=1 Tax=Sphingomonas vulcanisoli TaxID=1658060 RepID=A0ABX0TPE2_9SPHN|nr:DUF6489 family protein [Sphingomonas vulcanisoli]NIJ07404.1 hypothetical protein [Sphingomonas vulcanisoli]
MKITVDVDCTPEEARRFMGLPDLTAIHDAYLDKFKAAITDGVTPETFDAMMKSWMPMMPMGEASMTMWKQMIGQITGPKSGG